MNESFKIMLEAIIDEKVDVANNGNDGLEFVRKALIENKAYDLILCDYHMPDYKGDEVVRSIRHLEKESLELEKPSTIVIVTSDSGKASVISSLDCGADDYLIKPVPLEDLKACVQRYS